MQPVPADNKIELVAGATAIPEKVTLRYLFFTFLKIGMVAFGGHMALVSVVQRVMAEQDETIDNGFILNSIGIASLLPGPLAVNVVGQIGYRLRKAAGAAVSTIAVILPAFVLMLVLSWFYFSYRQTVNWAALMQYVPGAVSAIIVASGVQLYKKEVHGQLKKIGLCIIAVVALLLSGSYLTTIALIFGGAVVGVLLNVQTSKRKKTGVAHLNEVAASPTRGTSLLSKIIFGLLLINQILFFTGAIKQIGTGYLKIVSIFAGISLSLFGGGYVMIPIMQTLFVADLHWVTRTEFIDAIAFSQATPGPILISASFIGYKVAGFFGAFLATAAIFGPSVFLVVAVSKIVNKYGHNVAVLNMLGGIKAIVVGLILVSAYKIIAHEPFSILLLATFVLSFILNFQFKVSPVYLILGAIALGILKHFLLRS